MLQALSLENLYGVDSSDAAPELAAEHLRGEALGLTKLAYTSPSPVEQFDIHKVCVSASASAICGQSLQLSSSSSSNQPTCCSSLINQPVPNHSFPSQADTSHVCYTGLKTNALSAHVSLATGLYWCQGHQAVNWTVSQDHAPKGGSRIAMGQAKYSIGEGRYNWCPETRISRSGASVEGKDDSAGADAAFNNSQPAKNAATPGCEAQGKHASA
jgi:hypothetical protein